MSKPEKTFRIGTAQASVFVNSGEQGDFRTIQLQRRYKEGDEWKSSTSFTLQQAACAQAVLQLAIAYVHDQQEE